jgi:hypothetical protein
MSVITERFSFYVGLDDSGEVIQIFNSFEDTQNKQGREVGVVEVGWATATIDDYEFSFGLSGE